jgi:putative restriction endonuclease
LGFGEAVEVLKDRPLSKSNGYAERQKHIAQISNGAEGFGVVCKAISKEANKRNIASFDKATLLRLGEFVNSSGRTFAKIDGRVPTDVIAHQRTSQSTLTDDLRSILKKKLEPTVKEALVNARVGQGSFRVQVLQIWGHQCCVTASMTLEAIRASHIKPWRDSSDDERLDPHNGLPLTASLDALFDAGLISFDESNKLIVSSLIAESEREIFSIQNVSLSKATSPKTARYLAYHRANIFQD